MVYRASSGRLAGFQAFPQPARDVNLFKPIHVHADNDVMPLNQWMFPSWFEYPVGKDDGRATDVAHPNLYLDFISITQGLAEISFEMYRWKTDPVFVYHCGVFHPQPGRKKILPGRHGNSAETGGSRQSLRDQCHRNER